LSLLFALTLAYAGEVQRNTALRNGPGAFFPVCELLKAGQKVDTSESSGNWMAARTVTTNGWLPRLALKAPRSGVDYTGLLGAEDAVNVSSVDIAAATKGAFASSYSDRHGVDLDVGKAVDQIAVAPAMVSMLAKGLAAAPAGWLYGRLPHRPFDNSIILSQEAEALLGQAMVAHLAENGFADDRQLTDYVNGVAMLVGARTERYDCTYKVAILNDESVNGFGMPGGYILISKGYLDRIENEAELACVIAHEMAHISLFHGLREFKKREIHRRRDEVFAELGAITGDSSTSAIEADLNRLADTAYLKIIGGRAREDELEADLFGTAYAAAAGYDPRAMIELLQRVGSSTESDAFRHHPGIGERLETIQKGISRYKLARKGQRQLPGRFRMMTGRLAPSTRVPGEEPVRP
jgi:hypothetical protein